MRNSHCSNYCTNVKEVRTIYGLDHRIFSPFMTRVVKKLK